MGTETQRLQGEIKVLLKQLNWSQKRFARELLAMDEEDFSNAEETARFEERVKKNLTRPTISAELLMTYLQQLQQHRAFAQLDVRVPQLVLLEDVDSRLLEGMRAISAMLDND